MRTETEVTVKISTLTVTENLEPDPKGFLIKVFLSCSRADTKLFKANSQYIKIDQTLAIKNIVAQELQFWLCSSDSNIIAVGSLPIQEGGQYNIELQMLNTDFGKLCTTIQIRQSQIEKEEYIEPDEQLLKKEEDPILKRKKQEEEEARLAKEASEAAEAAKAAKKPAVTLTQYKRKDQPFV